MSSPATIIIPLKRQNDAWLTQCVRSALAQTVPCEVIVVISNATPPGNLQVLEALRAEGDLIVCTEPTGHNFPGALNIGIRRASAPRIGFLLSDDWLDPDTVAHCLPRSADIVVTGLTGYYADGVTACEGVSQSPTMAKFDGLPSLQAKASYLEHFFLFRKEALVAVDGLDESLGNFPGIDDYDLIWTLLERGASVDIVEKRLYNYRDHHGERLTLEDKTLAIATLEKILAKHNVPETERPQLIADQSRWFGRPVHEVIDEDRAKKRHS